MMIFRKRSNGKKLKIGRMKCADLGEWRNLIEMYVERA